MLIKRRTLLAFAVVAALGGTAAYGQDASTILIAQLEDQGFRIVLIEKTWLGRIRILAQKTNGSREIVLNPHTGEILRDLWTANVRGVSDKSASGSSGNGSGSGSTGGTGSGSGSGSGAGSGSGSGSGSGGSSGSGSGEDPEDEEEDEEEDETEDEAEDESDGH